MEHELIIPGTLPGLNEYINAERTNKHKAAAIKRQTERLICSMISIQLRGVIITKPVIIRYLWVEPNRRRDKDNIAFAKKFIQDALVSCGILRDDGWRYIDHFTDDFAVDSKKPRVEVIIYELQDQCKKSQRKRYKKIN